MGGGEQAEFPAQFARASLKARRTHLTYTALMQISRAICAGLIEGSAPRRLRSPATQFPAQFARASLKAGAAGVRALPPPKPISRAICAGLIEGG